MSDQRHKPRTANEPRSSNEPRAPAGGEKDWGIAAPKSRGFGERRIALLMVVCLLGTLAVVIYRKFEDRRQLAAQAAAPEGEAIIVPEAFVELPGQEAEPQPAPGGAARGNPFAQVPIAQAAFSEAGPAVADSARDARPGPRSTSPESDTWDLSGNSEPAAGDATGELGPEPAESDSNPFAAVDGNGAGDDPFGATGGNDGPDTNASGPTFTFEAELEADAAAQPNQLDTAPTDATVLGPGSSPWDEPAAPTASHNAGAPRDIEPVLDLFQEPPTTERGTQADADTGVSAPVGSDAELEPLRFDPLPAAASPVNSEARGVEEPRVQVLTQEEQAGSRTLVKPRTEVSPVFDFSAGDAPAQDHRHGTGRQEATASRRTAPGPATAFPAADVFATGARDMPDPFDSGAGPVINAAGQEAIEVHVVRSGDSYWTIAKECYGAGRYFNALAAYNKSRIPDPQRMRPGMKVLVPDRTVLESRFPTLVGGSYSPDGPSLAQPSGLFLDAGGQPSYRVGKGDSLTTIAQKHLGRSSRWVQIYGMNRDRIPDPNSLTTGTVLRLPGDASHVGLAPEGASSR
jgi:nucleoid-associated protein YgaU